MSFQFLSIRFFSRLLCTGMLACMVSLVSGQTILNGDGTTLTTTWCHEDTMHHIIGQPAGGIFSGCGVTEVNGEWYFNPAVAALGQTASYSCTLTYTPLDGNPVERQMSIYNPIVITFWEDSIITCDGSFYMYGDALPVGSFDWYWSPSDKVDNPTGKGTTGTTFSDEVFVFTAENINNGCSQSDTVYVFYRGVDAQFTASADTVCANERIYFTADSRDSSYGYTWHSGDGVSANGETWEYSYQKAGIYEVAHILNNDYCFDTLIRDIVVKDFTLELSASKTLADRGTPVILQTAAGEPYYVTAWRPAELLGDQTALSQQVIADTTRTYTVIGESAYGCVDSAEVSVEVNPIVYLPSSFTPNGDGKNDFFRIVNWGDPIIVTQFRIYDRWGREVWTGNGANAFTGWDGNYNGAPAEMGVYYYIFEGQLPSGAITAQQGDVTLLR